MLRVILSGWYFHLFWVIAMFCGLVIYLVNDRYRTRQAISWWQGRQIERLHQETELIRDRMLQDLFSLRRSLGVVIDGSHAESKLEPTLAIADQCHEDLAELSDRLFSPYAIENLEVALHELVERWSRLYPMSHFSYGVEGAISDAIQPNYQFLLIWLDEVCRLFVNQPPQVNLKILLQQQGSHMNLNLTIQTGAVGALPLDQVNDLRRVFSTIQKGRCTSKYQAGDQIGEWQIRAEW